ncbi:MAG: hypothetical protein ACHREM_22210, partial [Polyangiales bacterium]
MACTGSIGGPSIATDDSGAAFTPDSTANDSGGTGYVDAIFGVGATDGTAASADAGTMPPVTPMYDDCSSSTAFNCATSDPVTPLPFVNGAQASGCVCTKKCVTSADCPGGGTCVNGGNCLPPCGSTICPAPQQCLYPYKSGAMVCSPNDLATFVKSPPPGFDAGGAGGAMGGGSTTGGG